MCDMVSVVLPRDADVDEVSSVLERVKLAHGVGRRVLTFADGATMYELVPWARCWCGHTLGVLGDTPRRRSRRERDREVLKLARKGWGEAKIRRWAEQRDRNEDRAVDDYAHAFADAGMKPDSDWAGFIREVLERGLVSRIGIVHHDDFNQHHDDDIHEGPTKPLSTFLQRDIDAMAFGAILTVTR